MVCKEGERREVERGGKRRKEEEEEEEEERGITRAVMIGHIVSEDGGPIIRFPSEIQSTILQIQEDLMS